MSIRDEADIVAALRAQDERLRFTSFDHDDAIAVGTRIIVLARERAQTISTSVFRAPTTKAELDEYRAAGIDRAVLEIPDVSRDEILKILDQYAQLLKA